MWVFSQFQAKTLIFRWCLILQTFIFFNHIIEQKNNLIKNKVLKSNLALHSTEVNFLKI
jgi:hypothetical protein